MLGEWRQAGDDPPRRGDIDMPGAGRIEHQPDRVGTRRGRRCGVLRAADAADLHAGSVHVVVPAETV